MNKRETMDKKIKPKKGILKKHWVWGLPILLLFGLFINSALAVPELNIAKNKLRIKDVKFGAFENTVLIQSKVEPKTSNLINVVQGGAVAEVFADNGQHLKKGDPILRIHNPNAELGYLTQETAIVEQINNLRNIRISIKNQQINLDERLLSIKNDFTNAERQYLVDKVLKDKEVISLFEFQKSEQEYQFQKSRFNVIKNSVEKEKVNRVQQLKSINTSMLNMEKSLSLLRKNQEHFIVKAPVSGLLSSFKPILGKNYNQGESVGKIDRLDGYKLLAKVDEFYASKLLEGTRGEVTIQSQTFEIEIAKIHPEIKGGQFEMEMYFKSDSVLNVLKNGMTLKSKIYLSGNTKAHLLPKGRFFAATQGKWVFVLSDNNTAVKRNVKIGRENNYYYEIIEGLDSNDRVIISSYDDFKGIEIINLE